MDDTNSIWRPLLEVAVTEHGPVQVARELGYRNHTLVSRIIKNHVQASPKFVERVIAVYHVVSCPHTGKQQARTICKANLDAVAPTHNPGALAQWRACQRCPHQPGGKHEAD